MNKELTTILIKITNEEFYNELIRRVTIGEIWVGSKNIKVVFDNETVVNKEFVNCLGFKFGVKEDGKFSDWKFLPLLRIKVEKKSFQTDEAEEKLQRTYEESKEIEATDDFLKELVSKTERGLINLKYKDGTITDEEPSQAYLDYHYLETQTGYKLDLTTLKEKSRDYKLK